MAHIIIEPYYALPCECQTFTINGQDADKDDFGHNFSEIENYCCLDNCFFPENYDNPPEKILEKYNITAKEYRNICDELVDKCSPGSCGWCS